MKCTILTGAATLALIALVGCGGGGSTDEPDPTPSPVPTASPTPVPGVNGRIVYWSEEGGSADLYSINADGTGKIRLTNDAAADETGPDISPDGTKIVFLSNPKTSGSKTTIKIMNVDGSGQVILASGDTKKIGPHFSADSKKIIFQGDYKRSDTAVFPSDAIFTVNADGTDLVRVSKNDREDYESPDFSPDGTKIAYAMNDEIWVMNADGTGETKLTDGGMFYYLSPKVRPLWSPSGTKILYTSSNDSSQISDSAQAYTVNADGTGTFKIAGGNGLGWSPDGAKVLLRRTFPASPPQLLQINPDGTGETTLSFTISGGTW